MSKEIDYEKLRSVIRRKLQLLSRLLVNNKISPERYNILKAILGDIYYTSNPQQIEMKIKNYNLAVAQIKSDILRTALYIDFTEIEQT
jgi:hypothetical protein